MKSLTMTDPPVELTARTIPEMFVKMHDFMQSEHMDFLQVKNTDGTFLCVWENGMGAMFKNDGRQIYKKEKIK